LASKPPPWVEYNQTISHLCYKEAAAERSGFSAESLVARHNQEDSASGKEEITMATMAIETLDRFVFGHAPKPVACGHGLVIGEGEVVPELNFTLPPLDINDDTWPEVRRQYEEMTGSALERAVELKASSLLVEFETLPPMTIQPRWGLEITRILADHLKQFADTHGIRTALRLTPNDIREFERPPLMRRGKYWDAMVEMFDASADAGADMIAIESTGGKEICDDALVRGDLLMVVFSLGILGSRDMAFLWNQIVTSCEATGIIPAGDTACGFANTAMVLADKKMIPRIFAAVVRVASVPRSLVAYTAGARGPSKDCAYEGPYMKAIAGVPISMEGKSAACAHLSPVGNVSQAVCDCWSNESVQNVQMLSGRAPVVSLEQLVYDCRLMNTAAASSEEDAQRLRDWLTDSDSALDPQAYVLRPDVVLRIAKTIVNESTPYRQTKAAVLAALGEIETAHAEGRVHLEAREVPWIEILKTQAQMLPEDEQQMIDLSLPMIEPGRFLPEEYGIHT
jgi:methanol--5-hydroxybenzimidazolylcobamide Co-methyltransferase